MGQTEAYLERKFAQMCAESPFLIDVKIMKANRRGVPDRIVIYKGGVCFIEFKSPSGTGVLSIHQKMLHEHMRQLGHEVYVIDSENQFLDLPIFKAAENEQNTTRQYRLDL